MTIGKRLAMYSREYGWWAKVWLVNSLQLQIFFHLLCQLNGHTFHSS